MLAKSGARAYSDGMPTYRLERNHAVYSLPNIPETLGVDVESARHLAAAAESCITLADAPADAFLASLPPEAPDYHSYDDLTELIWRNWVGDPSIKPYATAKPNIARAKSMQAWQALIQYGSPELGNLLQELIWGGSSVGQKAAKSVVRRTAIADPVVSAFYQQEAVPGMGKTMCRYVQMLLAGSHPDMINPDWPDAVLGFMSSDTAE